MGGPSGSVSWPTYMQTFHSRILDESGTVTLQSSVVREVNTILTGGINPYFGKTAYDPSADITLLDGRVQDWIDYVDSLDIPGSFTRFNEAFSNAVAIYDPVNESIITADVAAFAAQQLDIINTQTLPRFQAGMLNINAINTSAYTIGTALILAFNDRDVAKFASETRLRLTTQRNEIVRLYVTQMMTDFLETARFHGAIAATQVDVAKLSTTTRSVQQEQQFSIDESEAKWNLSLFEYMNATLGAISGGGQGHIRNPRASAAVSALSGALTGAAAGSSISPGYGTTAGAIIGAGVALATR